MMHKDIFAGVLVGGRGQRLGGMDKARLQWGGMTLVERCVGALSPHVCQVILAARKEQSFAELQCPVVEDNAQYAGPLAGLEALLRKPVAPWLWMVAVDLPYVGGHLLESLAPARAAGILAVVPRSSHGLEPCAALYHRDLHAACVAAQLRNERALKRLLQQIPHAVVDCEDRELVNINRPEDLKILAQA